MVSKKIFLIIFLGFLCFLFTSVNNGECAEKKPMKISMAGLGVGGAWASIGEGVLECVRRSYPGSSCSYEAGQEGPNIILVSSGKLQIGIATSQFVRMAHDGRGPFKGRKGLDNIRTLATLYDDIYLQWIVKEETGIKSFEDIKRLKYPLKYNLNTKGSFFAMAGAAALEAYGITDQDIISWGGKVGYMSTSNSMAQMRDGMIEGYATTTQVPLRHFVDAALTLNLRLLPLSDAAIEKVNKKLLTRKGVIPKGTYTFNKDYEVPTVMSECCLFVSTKLSDDDAYAILAAMAENIDYLRNIHGSLKNISIKHFADTKEGAPLHPGAVKFYKEHGVF